MDERTDRITDNLVGAEHSGLVVDLGQLREYSGGDRRLELQFLKAFLENAATYVDAMEAATGTENWPQTVHKLKGAARAVGASQIAALSEIAESVGNLEKQKILTPQFRAQLDKVALFVAREYASSAADHL